ncbi:hypothetical protein [Polyangium sp. 15x6]|uniref:hypothetical protein n=1 Tax=Polyangium sp. 15x6 TaxID=3042687 RepID=UPI00249CE8D4|nr:hypothetical protein [Polyangium sp. 15x6]MDI3286675.1 hypothetical protein [Polyangium sp. 15x6]
MDQPTRSPTVSTRSPTFSTRSSYQVDDFADLLDDVADRLDEVVGPTDEVADRLDDFADRLDDFADLLHEVVGSGRRGPGPCPRNRATMLHGSLARDARASPKDDGTRASHPRSHRHPTATNRVPMKSLVLPALTMAFALGCSHPREPPLPFGEMKGKTLSGKDTECTRVPRTPEPAVAPEPDASRAGDDVESRIRMVAATDLRCSAQQVYVRGLHKDGDFEFYGAEGCGKYQLYRVSEKHGVEMEGVELFLVSPVSPGTLRIGSSTAFSARALSLGEAMLIVDKQGVACRATVSNEFSDTIWDLEGCALKWPIPFGLVAVRASDATNAVRLEKNWIAENVAPKQDGSESMWKPFTVVDLTGDRRKQVAVFCRNIAGEYECERFMVYRGTEKDPGWHLPIARGRWIPSRY